VFLVLVLERLSRGLARYQHTAGSRPRHSYRLSRPREALTLIACLLPIILGFGIPVAVLLKMTLEGGDALLGSMFLELAANSFSLAAAAAVLIALLALVIAYGMRLRPNPLIRTSARVAGMGYAIPGAVIAIGVLIPFAWLDNTLDGWMRDSFGISTGLLLTGTVGGLLFAYLVRFLALALNSVEAGLSKINRKLDVAARALGRGPGEALVRVHVPLMWGSLLSAVILVFVDVLKELPATLILRPFNFETLAIRVFRRRGAVRARHLWPAPRLPRDGSARGPAGPDAALVRQRRARLVGQRSAAVRPRQARSARLDRRRRARGRLDDRHRPA
jgi:iron(III) transport system permease protein